ncbi:class I poly(R)-hydroxyalkanoic acid synthase [Albimonas sp. CAU 1670]|uniref:PHA/PHB synthase family protein n=1 Tax=Albimonas sp. CAU 1670 TaxID=3032599 RepID=UPI0023DBAA55|nr:class I poly(R)-hydroxyalkanoic acid synthase [Albimonas sp. CAU 1670]MDF2234912.1 class I poly(R)-hydroxyalkanoic acid synthase [Albimonas sp. CAU 1670]
MEERDLASQAADVAADYTAFATNMAKVMETSQGIWMRLMQAQAKDDRPIHADPLNALPALAEMQQAFMNHPQQVAERSLQLWMAQAELMRRATAQWLGTEPAAPVKTPARGDKRFKHDRWTDDRIFDYIKQSYLLTAEYLEHVADDVGEEMDLRDRKKIAFLTKQFVDAMSPTNFAAMNPEVLEATFEQKGENLVRGLKMMAEDLERGKGSLIIRQTDMDAFQVGRDMAVTEGQVVFQNEVMQLIQYAPTTEQVHATPLLFIPPWINKYYILDLNTQKSLVKWMTEQGFTVFLISWVNPDERQKDETWDSYLEKGALTAIDKVLEETGQKTLNVTAYCIGGTLTATMLAYMKKTGDKRVKSCTFFTALTDFEDAGDLQVFVDENTLRVVDDQMTKGYLPAEAMANTFNMLRASDLIWNYVVSNYYLGKDPFPFDLLYWNADSTAMPAKVHHYYLEKFYHGNALSKGDLRVLNMPVALSDITVPVYHVASKEDHIAPAAAVYRGARLMTGVKEMRFVVAGSGHIAGVVNPPEMKKYQHWVDGDMNAEQVEDYLATAEERPGSWWPDWAAWLAKRSGRMVEARQPGAVLGTIEPAPGSYVKRRFDEE